MKNVMTLWAYIFKSKNFLYINPKVQSCIFHGDLQLSCWELPLNHFVSWWKFGLKLRENKKFCILRKFSKLKISTFQNQNLNPCFLDEQVSHFDIFWWIMIFSTWFDQKVKVWLFSIQLTFDQLTEKFICQSNGFVMFWIMLLGQNDAI